jgi:glycerol-3-phosphate cytidylyltransferase
MNIIRHAREQCDWLIVGVVTDDAIRRIKGVTPMVALEGRLAAVSDLALVDQVVVDDSADKVEMWHQLHFDILFKGDDWRGTPKGDRLEAGMASVGARVVYFPYTLGISSTLIRQGLEVQREGMSPDVR